MFLTVILSCFFSALIIAIILFVFVLGVTTGSEIRDRQLEAVENMRKKLMNK